MGRKYICGLFLTFIAILIALNAYAESGQRRYIFVDGGAHFGEALLAFKTTNLYEQYPWEIFAIEANPNVIKKLEKIPNIHILNKAIWIDDGFVEFNVAEEEGISSIYDDPRFKKPKKITVESIDFGRWLERNFSLGDYIIVSFDIQGAELDVLHKMLSDQTIQYVDRLYVEFHTFGLKELQEKRKEICIKTRALGILKGKDSVEDFIEEKDDAWVDYLED
jgi:FkbM family methyltransferase